MNTIHITPGGNVNLFSLTACSTRTFSELSPHNLKRFAGTAKRVLGEIQEQSQELVSG